MNKKNRFIFTPMVQHIIFDFGGVIYNIDFTRSFAAFEQLGFTGFRQLYSQHNASDLFRKLEKGLIEPAAFYQELRDHTGVSVSDEQLRHAWNALLIDYRNATLDYLDRLQKDYRLYLLSNTNRIHYDHFSAELQRLKGRSLESYFSRAWFSHEIHKRKPDTEIYEWVLADAGIDAADSLFIDDTSSNLPPAAALGIHTHLLLPDQRIETLNLSAY